MASAICGEFRRASDNVGQLNVADRGVGGRLVKVHFAAPFSPLTMAQIIA